MLVVGCWSLVVVVVVVVVVVMTVVVVVVVHNLSALTHSPLASAGVVDIYVYINLMINLLKFLMWRATQIDR